MLNIVQHILAAIKGKKKKFLMSISLSLLLIDFALSIK
jgi:hypothetical protein